MYSIEISVSDGISESSIYFDLTVTEPIFFFRLIIKSLDKNRDMEVELSGCAFFDLDRECVDREQTVLIAENGTFLFGGGLETGSEFRLDIKREPGRQDCTLGKDWGVVGSTDEVIEITCQNDESWPLFDLGKLHHVRLTMDIEEWDALVLDIGRSNDTDAIGGGRLDKTSQVYRQVDFDYLDDLGNTLYKANDVGFKMKDLPADSGPNITPA